MGGDHRRRLRVVYSQERIHNSLPHSSHSVKQASLFSSKGPIPHLASTRSSKRVTGKTGSGNGGGSRVTWFLQPPFSSQEKERQIKTSDRPVSFKQVRSIGKVQDGNAEISSNSYSERFLDRFHRPAGRVPPRSYTSVVQEIPEVHDLRESLPISRTPMRTVYSPNGVHKIDEVRGGLHQETGSQSNPISGRLADLPHFARSPRRTSFQSLGDCHKARTSSEHGKVRSGSKPKLRVHWDVLPNESRNSESACRQSRQNCATSVGFDTEILLNSKEVPVITGHPQCSGRLCGNWQATYTPITAFAALPMETTVTAAGPHHLARPDRLQAPYPMVATTPAAITWSAHALPAATTPSVYGFQPLRMGGPSGAAGDGLPRYLATRSRSAPYQPIGTESCFYGNAQPAAPYQGQVRNDCDGQLDRRVIYTQAGMNPFSFTISRDMGSSSIMPPEQHHDQGASYSGQTECDSGQPLQGDADSHGMVHQSASGAEFVQSLGNTHAGSVRHEIQQQTTAVCVPCTRQGSSGSGCASDQLGKLVRVRFSSTEANPTSSQAGQEVECTDHPVGTKLATDVVVQRSPRPTDRLPQVNPIDPEAVNSEQHIAQQPRHVPPSRLDVVRDAIRKRRFSSKIAGYVSSARRPSTNKVYQARWRIFRDWCGSNETDPLHPSIPRIADFFIFLFESKGCQPATIRGYRSMLSNTLRFGRRCDIGTNHVLSELIKSFQLRKPVTRSLTPKWNLSWVLLSLNKAPYEPLSEASMLDLTVKTVFLLSLASARRVSEIHALSVEEGAIRFNKNQSSVSLLPQPGFLAKNQCPSVTPEVIQVPGLASFSGSDSSDRLLCPVRALRFYLARVKSRRGARKRLFLPVSGTGNVSKDSVSRWIKQAIIRAYKLITDRDLSFMKIRAHEVRAISSSLAFSRRVPLQDVMKAAYWHSHSTFSSFYMRSLIPQGENISSLGPLVAAQTVIH